MRKGDALSATRWTATSMAVTTLVQIFQLSILARIVQPAEFGLMAVVVSVSSVMALFSDAGLSRALVYFDTPDKATLSSLFWLNLGFGLVLMLVLAGLSFPVGGRLDSPRLAWALLLASAAFPLNSLGQQFRAIAQKRLEFRSLASIDMGSAVVGATFAIGAARAGWEVFALVTGMLASAATNSALSATILSRGTRPGFHFRLSETLPYLKYGLYLTGESLFSVLRQQVDVFIGSMAIGAGAIASYSVPRDFNQRVSMAVNSVMTRVAFPVMAQVKSDRSELARIYLGLIRLTTSINFPIYIAIALFAPDIVAVLYGNRWSDATFYMRIMAVWGVARSLANPMGSLVYAAGKARRVFWWNAVLFALFVPTIALSVRYGHLAGLAVSVMAFQLATVMPAWRCLISPSCGLGLRPYLSAISAPMVLASVACLAAWLACSRLDSHVLRLLAAAIVGAPLYLLLCLRFNEEFVAGIRSLLRPSATTTGND